MENLFRNQGKGVTLRFSPGYCDWPISEQKKVFELVQADMIGVSLNESFLMNPRKSVSGLFGITEEPSQTVSGYNPCVHCNKRDCFSRRS
jgi:cobalamin-dependent methionine synthase I